jgi:hypothetical protein
VHVHRQNARTSKTTNHNGAKVSDPRPTRRGRNPRMHNSDNADGRCGGCGGVDAMIESVTIDRDIMGTMHIKIGEFDFIQIQYQHPFTDNAGTKKLAERIVKLLAQPEQPAGEVPEVVAWVSKKEQRRDTRVQVTLSKPTHDKRFADQWFVTNELVDKAQHEQMMASKDARIEDLLMELSDTEYRRENAVRNSSGFENAMGELQVANGELKDRIAELKERVNSTTYRTSLIGKLEADNQRILDDLNMAWQEVKSEQRLSFRDQADQLRTELAALREQVPMMGQKAAFEAYLFDCGIHQLQPDVAGAFAWAWSHVAPVAKQQVVMPGREGGHAQKSFWAGFEVARMRPDESNIRTAWNEFKSSEQFTRLNAVDQEGDA